MRWRPVVGFAGYEVSDTGLVRSWRNGTDQGRSEPRILRHASKPSGHRYVVLTLPHSKQVHRYVHRLVMEAFVGPAPKDHECAHFDRDPTNNHVTNLRWATHKENGGDMTRHGIKAGENHHLAKLSNRDARTIRESAESTRVLAEKYRVSTRTINRVRSGFTFANI